MNKGWRGEQSMRQKKKSRGKWKKRGRRRVNKLGDLDYRPKENCSSVSLCVFNCV